MNSLAYRLLTIFVPLRSEVSVESVISSRWSRMSRMHQRSATGSRGRMCRESLRWVLTSNFQLHDRDRLLVASFHGAGEKLA